MHLLALKASSNGWLEKRECQFFSMWISWYIDRQKVKANMVQRSWTPVLSWWCNAIWASLSLGNCAALVSKRLSKIYFKISLHEARDEIDRLSPIPLFPSFLSQLKCIGWVCLLAHVCCWYKSDTLFAFLPVTLIVESCDLSIMIAQFSLLFISNTIKNWFPFRKLWQNAGWKCCSGQTVTVRLWSRPPLEAYHSFLPILWSLDQSLW